MPKSWFSIRGGFASAFFRLDLERVLMTVPLSSGWSWLKKKVKVFSSNTFWLGSDSKPCSFLTT